MKINPPAKLVNHSPASATCHFTRHGWRLLRSTSAYAVRFMPLILALGLMTGMTGCLPFPHTTQRLYEVRGRVLDASAQTPIQGAEIFLTEHPNYKCKTDSMGYFRLKEINNFHLLLIAPEGEWPARQGWWPNITVSHPNYQLRQIQNDFADKGDVLLSPK